MSGERQRKYIILIKPILYLNIFVVYIGFSLMIVVRNVMLIMMITYITMDEIHHEFDKKYDIPIDDRT